MPYWYLSLRYLPEIVHGGYSSWAQWSLCDVPCGGSRTRVRTCTNPLPQHGGNDCAEFGSSQEQELCNNQDCCTGSKGKLTVYQIYTIVVFWSCCSCRAGSEYMCIRVGVIVGWPRSSGGRSKIQIERIKIYISMYWCVVVCTSSPEYTSALVYILWRCLSKLPRVAKSLKKGLTTSFWCFVFEERSWPRADQKGPGVPSKNLLRSSSARGNTDSNTDSVR